jgi:hypothetical protein
VPFRQKQGMERLTRITVVVDDQYRMGTRSRGNG